MISYSKDSHLSHVAGLDIPGGEKPINNDLNLEPTSVLCINAKYVSSSFNIYQIFQECNYYCNSRENGILSGT